MGHGQSTREEQERHDIKAEMRRTHLESSRQQARHIDALESILRDADVVLKDALPYVNNEVIKGQMKDVRERAALWRDL